MAAASCKGIRAKREDDDFGFYFLNSKMRPKKMDLL